MKTKLLVVALVALGATAIICESKRRVAEEAFKMLVAKYQFSMEELALAYSMLTDEDKRRVADLSIRNDEFFDIVYEVEKGDES